MTATAEKKSDRKRMLQLEKRGFTIVEGLAKYKPNRDYLKGDTGAPKWELRITGKDDPILCNEIECFGRVQTLASREKDDGCGTPEHPVLLVRVKGAVAFK